jgi:hypothetical protein
MDRPDSPRRRGDGAARADRRSLPPIFTGVAFTLLLFALAVPAAAASWRFEAEDIRPSSCYAAIGVIRVVACHDASGGLALEGLSALGDWAEITVTFDRETCFIDSIRCASLLQSSWQFLVEFRPVDSPEGVVASNEHAGVTGRGIT